MKILHVNDRFSAQGGVGQYILNTAKLLREYGDQSVALYRVHEQNTITDDNLCAYHVDTQSVNYTDSVRAVIGAEQPDVAFIHHVSSPELVEEIVSLLPTIVYVHGFAAICPGLGKYYRRDDRVCTRRFSWGCVPMHYWRRCSDARHPVTLYRLMTTTARLKAGYNSVQRVIVASNYMHQLLVQNGFQTERITILPPHFVSPNSFPPSQDIRNPTTILFAGRLEVEKGVPYILHALVQLPPSVRLVLAGEGTQRNQYEKLVTRLGLESRVHFTGWLSSKALRTLYQTSTVAVLPTIAPEAFGKAGVEALEQGCPVVAFNVGGISDWLEDEFNGLLVEPRSVVGLTNAIEKIIENPHLRQRMGIAGQLTVAERFGSGHHLSVLRRVFTEVIEAYNGSK